MLGGETFGCPHIEELSTLRLDSQLDLNNGLQCYMCDRGGPSLWLCVRADCLRVMCSEGSTNHSLVHYQKDSSHCLRVNLASLHVWCLACQAEVLPGGPAPHHSPGQQLDPGPKPKGVAGLQNMGNTCYMNAALQALSNCPPLVASFLASPSNKPGPLTAAFHRLMLDLWAPKTPPYLAPTSILYAMRNTHPMFRGFGQHDTQEFLRCLMDQLHEEMKTPDLEPPLSQVPRYLSLDTLEQISESEGGTASSQSEGEEYETCDSGVSERSSLSDEAQGTTKPLRSISRTPSPSADLRRLKSGQSHLGSPSRRKHIRYRSIISDVFDGKLVSSVQCLTCNRVSTRVETFQDLSLPIPNRDHLTMLHQGSVNTSPTKCAHLYSTDQGWWAWLWDWVCSWFWGPTVGLHDCLAAFFSADELKGDNMYSCEKCNKLRNGVKYSRVLQCPEVLCIHLKRFRHELMFSSKMASFVSFPLEDLDLRPYLHSNCRCEVTSYDLTAVICHHGSAGGGGHYTCFALNAATQRWYEFDDQSVRHVSPDTVANAEAYVLFYRKDSSSVNRVRRKAWRLEEMSNKEVDTASSEERFLISKLWLERFNTFAEPGPIENRPLVCQHGLLAPDAENLVVSQPVWQYLYSKFGGGPACRLGAMTPCDQCSDTTGELSLLRVQLHEFLRLQKKRSSVGYGIRGSWLAEWEAYVKQESLRPPGPIDNSPLLSNAEGEDVCELTAGQWEMLVKLYGGGPAVPLKEADTRSSSSGCDDAATDSGCWVPPPPPEPLIGTSLEEVTLEDASTWSQPQAPAPAQVRSIASF